MSAPNLKITQLNAAEPLAGTEIIECVQDGANVQTTLAQVAAASSQTDSAGNDLLPLYSTVKQSAALHYGAL